MRRPINIIVYGIELFLFNFICEQLCGKAALSPRGAPELIWTNAIIFLLHTRQMRVDVGWLSCWRSARSCFHSAFKSLQESKKRPLRSLNFVWFFFLPYWRGLLSSQKTEISPVQRVSRSCLLKITEIMGFSCLTNLYSIPGTASCISGIAAWAPGGGRPSTCSRRCYSF